MDEALDSSTSPATGLSSIFPSGKTLPKKLIKTYVFYELCKYHNIKVCWDVVEVNEYNKWNTLTGTLLTVMTGQLFIEKKYVHE